MKKKLKGLKKLIFFQNQWSQKAILMYALDQGSAFWTYHSFNDYK